MKRYKEPVALKRERRRLEKLGSVTCTRCWQPIGLRWFAEAHKEGHPVVHGCGRVLCEGRFCP